MIKVTDCTGLRYKNPGCNTLHLGLKDHLLWSFKHFFRSLRSNFRLYNPIRYRKHTVGGVRNLNGVFADHKR